MHFPQRSSSYRKIHEHTHVTHTFCLCLSASPHVTDLFLDVCVVRPVCITWSILVIAREMLARVKSALVCHVCVRCVSLFAR